jgi:phospholipid/cholesterol/gamma-HCH transport system ATP-binding protein
VTCGYGDKVILRDIDLSVRHGEILTILGGSGCGKSTLLKVLIGLLPPLAGKVLFLGKDLYAISEPERNELLRQMGVMFQAGALFGSLSAGENIAWPIREHLLLPEPIAAELARMKLALVGLSQFEHALPSDLSGGQRKRVGLARALALDPVILFCDEPSAGLDPVTAAAIDETFLELRETLALTVVAVTHELQSIKRISDRAIMLGDRGILAQGTVAELAQSENQEVRDFFARKAASDDNAAASVLDLWGVV